MTKSPSSQTVLVTGASGFIALHCILQLLEQGYKVRGTLRTTSHEKHLREILMQYVDIGDNLKFVIANLLKDDGWDEATNGCEFVLHTASPFPSQSPKSENDLLIPARDGSERVLKASASNGVKRVVMTSSSTAIVKGHKDYNKTFDESDWSNLDGDIGAYAKSKVLAERTAWDFVNKQETDHPIELTVIIPGLVLGPLLDGENYGTSAKIIRDILLGENRGDYRNRIELVDVRDVASAHLSCMTNPLAAGKRYCCVADVLERQKIINILDQHFSGRGYKILTQEPPDSIDELGRLFNISNRRIVQELGWQPHSAEVSVVAMGESLIQNGIV
jgi:dihydroflavonol-4-reductase